MTSLSLNLTHDASLTLMRDGEIVLHSVEERLSRKKYAMDLYHAIDDLKNYVEPNEITDVTYAGIWNAYNDHRIVARYLKYKGYIEDAGADLNDGGKLHHLFHALCGYWSSPFDKPAILVIDGAGSDLTWTAKENETIFDVRDDYKPTVVHKTVVGFRDMEHPYCTFKPRIGIGMVYNAITEYLGFGGQNEGKTMGLSSYAKNTANYHQFANARDGGNEECFHLISSEKLGIKGADTVVGSKFEIKKSFKIPPRVDIINDDTNKVGTPTFNFRANVAGKVQKDLEEYIYEMVLKTIELTGKKDIVLTGGCFMNCVCNYKLVKRLPEDVNLYVDPLCTDVGISVGGSMFNEYAKERMPKKYDPTYLGAQLKYDYDLKDGQFEEDTTPQKVASLLASGNIVAIAQGKSESGKRALGNRSILFDPTVKDGKEIVNRVKKREDWRPFAGTVMLEYAKDWFDMDKLQESPHMTYAIDVHEDKRDLIPSINHVNNTCRIQTVTQKQNENYYNLISEFHKLTGTPIVLNTSFNLAGDPIVESIEDALDTLERSEIEYLYLPEIMKLIYIPNK